MSRGPRAQYGAGGGGTAARIDAAGATAVTNGGANRVLFESASQNVSTSANFTYTETLGPMLQVGTSGTSAGVKIGYGQASGQFGIYNAANTPTGSNYHFWGDANRAEMGSSSVTTLFITAGGANSSTVSSTAWLFASPIKPKQYTVATLPSAATFSGHIVAVTDSGAIVPGGIVAGGGAAIVPVYSDGTNWRYL